MLATQFYDKLIKNEKMKTLMLATLLSMTIKNEKIKSVDAFGKFKSTGKNNERSYVSCTPLSPFLSLASPCEKKTWWVNNETSGCPSKSSGMDEKKKKIDVL